MQEEKTKKILLVIVFLLLFFVSLQTCKIRKRYDPIIEKTTVVDTAHVSYVDTIDFYNIIDSIRWVNLPILSATANKDSSEFSYLTDVSDSLIAGTISTIVKADGTLINQGLTYLPKFPKYITKVDTFWINKETTITVKKPNWGIYGGLMVAPLKNISIVGTIGLKTKKDMYFGIGYDPIRSNVYLDVKMQLFRRRRNG